MSKKETKVFGIEMDRAKELCKDLNFENEKLRLKFMLVMPYFLKFGDVLTMSFKEISTRIRVNVDDLKIFVNLFGIVISSARYKKIKNSIFERLDLPDDPITEDDEDEFFITPYFVARMDGVGQDDITGTQADVALALYDLVRSEIIDGASDEFTKAEILRKLLDRERTIPNGVFVRTAFEKFMKKVDGYNYYEMVNEIIIDFLENRVINKAEIIEKIEYFEKTRFEIIDYTVQTLYEYFLKDVRLIELNLEYRFDWVEVFASVYTRIQKKQKKHFDKIKREIWEKEVQKQDEKAGIDTENQSMQWERKLKMVALLQTERREGWTEMGQRVMKEIEYEKRVLKEYAEKLLEFVKEIRGE